MINMLEESFSFPPKSGEEITIRITNRPCKRMYMESGNMTYVILCELYKLETVPKNGIGQVIELSKDIYQGMLAELKKNNVTVDENLECLKKVWTICGVEWKGETVHRVHLRIDLL